MYIYIFMCKYIYVYHAMFPPTRIIPCAKKGACSRVHVHTCTHMYMYKHAHTSYLMMKHMYISYGVASMSRLLKILGLFCRI